MVTFPWADFQTALDEYQKAGGGEMSGDATYGAQEGWKSRRLYSSRRDGANLEVVDLGAMSMLQEDAEMRGRERRGNEKDQKIIGLLRNTQGIKVRRHYHPYVDMHRAEVWPPVRHLQKHTGQTESAAN